jgi:hypothetical protein
MQKLDKKLDEKSMLQWKISVNQISLKTVNS